MLAIFHFIRALTLSFLLLAQTLACRLLVLFLSVTYATLPILNLIFRVHQANRTADCQRVDLSLPLLVGEDDQRCMLTHRAGFGAHQPLYTLITEVSATTFGQVGLPLYGAQAYWAREIVRRIFDEESVEIEVVHHFGFTTRAVLGLLFRILSVSPQSGEKW